MTFLILKGDIIHSESNAVVDDAIGAYKRAGTHALQCAAWSYMPRGASCRFRNSR